MMMAEGHALHSQHYPNAHITLMTEPLYAVYKQSASFRRDTHLQAGAALALCLQRAVKARLIRKL